MVVTCTGIPPSGRNLKNISPDVPFLLVKLLNFFHAMTRWWIGRYHVKFDHVLMKSNGGDLEKIKVWVEEGKIKPVVGKVLKFANLEGIREECIRMKNGKGGVGKVVIDIITD